MGAHSDILQAIKTRLEDETSLTTVQVSQRPVDPKLYTLAQLPLLNIIDPEESWGYEASRQSLRTYPVTMELVVVAWDGDQLSGSNYIQGIVDEIKQCLHADIRLGHTAVKLDMTKHSTRTDDNFPRFIVDVTITVLQIEDYRIA